MSLFGRAPTEKKEQIPCLEIFKGIVEDFLKQYLLVEKTLNLIFFNYFNAIMLKINKFNLFPDKKLF